MEAGVPTGFRILTFVVNAEKNHGGRGVHERDGGHRLGKKRHWELVKL